MLIFCQTDKFIYSFGLRFVFTTIFVLFFFAVPTREVISMFVAAANCQRNYTTYINVSTYMYCGHLEILAHVISNLKSHRVRCDSVTSRIKYIKFNILILIIIRTPTTLLLLFFYFISLLFMWNFNSAII